MLLYLLIIAVCMLIIAGIVTLALAENFLFVLLWTTAGVALIMAVDGLTATVARLMPDPKKSRFFDVPRKEKQTYEKWRIRKWKDKVPEIGHFTGFRKNKLDDPKSVAYVERFLMESRCGEVGHIVSCVTGALIFLVQLIPAFPAYWWMLCIGIVFVNAALNIPTVFVLRYNYYKLTALKNALIKKEQKLTAASLATATAKDATEGA